MLSPRESLDRALDLGVYTAITVLLCTAVAWSAFNVTQRVLALVDQHIVDGSGNARASIALSDQQAGEATEAKSTDKPIALPPATASKPPLVLPPTEVSNGDDPASAYHNGTEGTYRTFCVRLCDGYFWPLSFSTSSDRFDEEASRCEQSCGSPARLFVQPIPGSNQAEMTTVEGVPYKALKTAFLFRTRYDSQCKCQAHPWEQTAQRKHQLFAAREKAEKGDPKAKALASTLASAVAADRESTETARAVANAATNRELEQLARRTGATPVRIARTRPQPHKVRIVKAIERPEGMMGLGASDEPPSKYGWRPATGSRRHWKESVFSGN